MFEEIYIFGKVLFRMHYTITVNVKSIYLRMYDWDWTEIF